MSFTLDELRAAIEETDSENWMGEDFYYEVGYAKEQANERGHYGPIEIPGIGKAVGVEQFGGMDQGSDLWTVFRILGDDRLFRKNGYYASHDGSYYDGALEQVEAFEKTVTDYRRV